MGDVYWSIHAPLVSRISRALNIDYAFETGTYYGVGTLQLAGLFKKVWSVDNDKVLSEFAKNNFGHLENIQLLYGSSAVALEQILPAIDRGVLFFLDAHWFSSSPRNSFRPKTQCAIMAELEAIAKFLVYKEKSVILIDDAEMFLKSLPAEYNSFDFPKIGEVMAAAKNSITAEFVDVMDDVIVAGPSMLAKLLEEYEVDRGKAGAPFVQ